MHVLRQLDCVTHIWSLVSYLSTAGMKLIDNDDFRYAVLLYNNLTRLATKKEDYNVRMY